MDVLMNRDELLRLWDAQGPSVSGLGDYAEALAIHDRVLENQPNNKAAWYGRADALISEAFASYDKALDPGTGNRDDWYRRADALMGEAHANYDRAMIIPGTNDHHRVKEEGKKW